GEASHDSGSKPSQTIQVTRKSNCRRTPVCRAIGYPRRRYCHVTWSSSGFSQAEFSRSATCVARIQTCEPCERVFARRGARETKRLYSYFLRVCPKTSGGITKFSGMRRIEASRRNASALRLRFSQSLASLRQRLSQAKVRSTTQRRGSTTNPLVRSERLTISVSS